MQLTKEEWSLVRTAVDAMVDSLPLPDNVPEVDREDAKADREPYVALQAKLAE